jgi:phenylacetate-CoA ligase
MKQYFDELESRLEDERNRDQRRCLSIMMGLAYDVVPSIKEFLDSLGVKFIDEISWEQWWEIPVTSREKLIEAEAAAPPFGGLVDQNAQIDRIFVSPGPVYEPHLSEMDPLWARAYFAAGLGAADVVLNTFSYHMVAAGLTFHAGLRKVGATVVPSGTASTEMQVQLIRDLGVTAFTGTPSFLMSIIEKSKELGFDFVKDFKLRKACFAAEPLQPILRERFDKEYGIDTYQMYGATEVGDIAYECSEKKGWHICEEVLVEIVDPQTGRVLPHGEFGEVVVTRFNRIFFLFRFGTGDLSRIIAERCHCGRTSLRLDGIVGRVGEAVKVRGMFLAPSQIRKVSERFSNLRIQAILQRTRHEDYLTIRIERQQPDLEEKRLWEENFKRVFKEICTVRIDKIEWLDLGTIKANDKLIIDERSWK